MKWNPPIASALCLALGLGLAAGSDSQGAARPAAAPLPRPVAVWDFEDGSTCDQQGRRCAAPLGTALAQGVAVLSGPGDALLVPAARAPRLGGPLTAAAWVAASPDGGMRSIVSQGDGAGSYQLGLAGGRYRFTVRLGRGDVTVTAPVPGDGWAHVAGVFDGRRTALYVNGRLAAAGEAPGAPARPRAVGALTIGGQGAAAAAGWLIDDVRLYATALGPDQIAALARSAPGAGPGRTACAGQPDALTC